MEFIFLQNNKQIIGKFWINYQSSQIIQEIFWNLLFTHRGFWIFRTLHSKESHIMHLILLFNFLTHAKIFQTHATHAKTWPTPPTLFSRLVLQGLCISRLPALAPICIYRWWPPICIYRPWSTICLPGLVNANLCLPNLHSPPLAPNLYLYPGQDFTTITTATCTTTTATTTTTTTNNNNDNSNYNKRCLRGSKICIKWSLKLFDEKIKSCCSKFVSVMASVSLKREATVVIVKKLTASCFWNESR